MADGKNTIVIYRDWKNIFDKLTDDEAGRLIKHLFAYVNDENPQCDRLIELVFEPIKLTLKRDLKHWETVIERRREAGRQGGRPKKEDEKQNEAKKANALFEKQTKAKKADSDIDIVIDSVIDSEINNKENREKSTRFVPPTQAEIQNYCFEKNSSVDPITFFNFYEAKNWFIGKNKMKNWKAAIATWETKNRNQNSIYGNQQQKSNTRNDSTNDLLADVARFAAENVGRRD